jgi:hypothetical protein
VLVGASSTQQLQKNLRCVNADNIDLLQQNDLLMA